MRKPKFFIVFLFFLWIVERQAAYAQQNDLRLTEVQRKSLMSILTETKSHAEPLAKRLIDLQVELNRNFLSDKPHEPRIRQLKKQISQLVGKLVERRMDDIHKMLKLLTPDQKKLVAAESTKPNGEKDLFNVLTKMLELPEK